MLTWMNNFASQVKSSQKYKLPKKVNIILVKLLVENEYGDIDKWYDKKMLNWLYAAFV